MALLKEMRIVLKWDVYGRMQNQEKIWRTVGHWVFMPKIMPCTMPPE
jgi:hypothetical protein